MTLLNAQGQPIVFAASPAKNKQVVTKPRVGDLFGAWAGRDETFMNLPGGGVMQFDLNRLTLQDYRSMRQHYQLGSSLNVLSFVMHQIDWEIECDDSEIQELIDTELRSNWTPFIRAISQSFWAGYSPIAVNYENKDGYTRIERFKDITPEEARVEWESELGWAPPNHVQPKLYRYNGFKQCGYWIPPENTVWYPLLMENGDYYGRKLLKPAFPAWFFSNLIHLFSNRYFERFGEPLPVGRARFGDDVDMGDNVIVSGKVAMENIVQSIRNRSVVVLPSDRDPVTKEYDFDIQYLESQMRGADFERYLSRLDEEMSLSVFTPILLFRTADVGSYNLGQAHLKIFQQMLNAIAGDIQYYIQRYIVDRLKALNFPGNKVPVAKWVFRQQGQSDIETYKMLMAEVVRAGRGTPDLEELGRVAGLKFDEVVQLTAPVPAPGATSDPGSMPPDPKMDTTPPTPPKPKPKVKNSRAVLDEATTRVAAEVGKGNVNSTLGFRNKFVMAMQARDDFSEAEATELADSLYGRLNTIIANAAPVVDDGAEMKSILQKAIDIETAA
jgi:hypothetical protein